MTEPISRENPARPSEIVGSVPVGVPPVEAADAAFGRWSRTPIQDRLRLLEAAADTLEPHLGELAVLLARETGKVLADCRGELAFSLTFLRWVASRAAAVLADAEVDDAAGRMLLLRKPFGVVAAITPWNAPIILAMLKIAPALAAGNTIVVKPSPLAPLTIDRVVRLLAPSLPVFIVHGGADVGAALVGHPLVRKVAFTGGSEAARHVLAAAATQITPTVMELGGNDAAIFLPDADLSPSAMQRLVMASFATSGQVCMAAKRLYVHSSIRERFVESYLEAASVVLRTGDPLAEGVTMGPLISAQAARRVRSFGAGLPLGRVDDGLADGYFVAPSLVLDPPPGSPLVTQEQFGPTVPMLTYSGLEEVIAQANAGELGLGASIWSADEEHAFAVARRIEAGFVFVNTHNRTGLALRAPFGGVKRSGFGREYGDEGIAEYAQTCVVHAPAAFRAGGAGLAANAYPAV
ncbi:aldehyde dehydrogenase [Rhizocola hellebori]|uniref:Aldehyde dehydrogenase n=1 Tax=Rhizocola hellebori TaxID=1392758 RepID=A0A8J3Q381_9ACTN|nr:aldehyde dehydrogenase family protein [Rhizocola hellebori]GIH02405.1 aldehyde dehydrogenase [Rhizocola hellebori]